ncbi:MAG: DNA mismatch repair endonuclease MutL [Bacteroidales bacterium]|jgi:DNA mismatch repair protein MutL|nr:DNA mismatch repair endonuclease MutL [Bacteroidales bacterium]
MAIIKLLSDVIANQIAAGEVVNRPASVVKELMENAIDAGATDITLIIKDAGKTLIQVIDNGCGMDKDDAQMSFTAHATSKIQTADDLYNLNTMGFRGEALASIAAISFIEMKTKLNKSELGTIVNVEGGQIKKVEPVSCEKGTSISVKNLFFNTPARRNFLKADSIENDHITNEFIRIALFYNDVSFTYYNNGKIVFKLDKTNMRKRLSIIFGRNYDSKILPLDEDTDLVKIHGFISKIELVRKKKDEQYFFVNGRFMRNNYFANAVERAYIGLIPDHTHPFFVINLFVNPKNIDVNIHPTKTEIKFLDDKFIYSILLAATKRSLGQFTLESEIDWNLPTTMAFSASPTTAPLVPPSINYNPNYNPFNPNKSFDHSTSNDFLSSPKILFNNLHENTNTTNDISKNSHTNSPYQVAQKYIIVPNNEYCIVVHQQRASLRILYDEFISSAHSNVKGQQFLFPLNHFFNPAHSFRLLELSDELKNYGFELEYLEDGSFNITAAPNNLSSEQIIDAIDEFIDSLDENNNSKSEREHKIALSLAKRLCIKDGDILTENEVVSLISQLFSKNNYEISPLNERILTRLSTDYLDSLLS